MVSQTSNRISQEGALCLGRFLLVDWIVRVRNLSFRRIGRCADLSSILVLSCLRWLLEVVHITVWSVVGDLLSMLSAVEFLWT